MPSPSSRFWTRSPPGRGGVTAGAVRHLWCRWRSGRWRHEHMVGPAEPPGHRGNPPAGRGARVRGGRDLLPSKSQPCDSSTAGGRPLWIDCGTPAGSTQETACGRQLHPPPRPHRVLDARRRGPGGRRRGGGRGRRAAGHRDHRPRQHVRRPALLQGRPQRRHQADRRQRAVHGLRGPHRAHQRARPHGRHRRRGRGRPQALLPPDHPGRVDDRLPQPDPALEPRLPRGLLPQAEGRLGAPRRPQRGDHRHDRAASAATCSRSSSGPTATPTRASTRR